MTTTERMRVVRARRKAEEAGEPVAKVRRLPVVMVDGPEPLIDPPWPADPAEALGEWSRSCLVVPPGHAKAGEPLVLPSFAVRFLRDAMRPGVREALLTCGRKNAKSAVLAVLMLGFLAEDGPLRRQGFRAGVASVSRDKASELWAQMEAIALASGLEGIRFGKVPRHVRSPWGRVDFLSADRTAGHASGYDVALADEMGLYPEKGRALVAGLLSSTSAKDGRLIAISVMGDSRLTAELVQRRDDPSVVVHSYAAPAGCALDDESAWHAANPGIAAGIKSLSYMRDMARRAAALPSEQASFRAFDLNQTGSPVADAVVALSVWEAVERQPKPERSGLCFVGYDIGGSSSLTAACAFWPETGRLDCWGAAGDLPNLVARGEADGVADRYQRMADRGELRTYPGRVTPVAEFLALGSRGPGRRRGGIRGGRPIPASRGARRDGRGRRELGNGMAGARHRAARKRRYPGISKGRGVRRAPSGRVVIVEVGYFRIHVALRRQRQPGVAQGSPAGAD